MNYSFNPHKQSQLAEKLNQLHQASNTLVLPNVWDCVSAKLFENADFQAIATTSSGISWSCGYQDGEQIPTELMLRVLGRIAQSVEVPVTADVEAGYYRNDLTKFKQFITRLIEVGVVGVNLEDGDSTQGDLVSVVQQSELLKVAKQTALDKGVNLFINARTDAMMYTTGDIDRKLEESVKRANAFKQAGADGIFVPFVKDEQTVKALKKAIDLPLNILMTDSLSVKKLKTLKVDRISVGSRPILASMNLLTKIASELKTTDNWESLLTSSPNYGEANAWF